MQKQEEVKHTPKLQRMEMMAQRCSENLTRADESTKILSLQPLPSLGAHHCHSKDTMVKQRERLSSSGSTARNKVTTCCVLMNICTETPFTEVNMAPFSSPNLFLKTRVPVHLGSPFILSSVYLGSHSLGIHNHLGFPLICGSVHS